MKYNKLNNLSKSLDLISDTDDRIEAYREDTMMKGAPCMVLRARDENEIKEVLQYCDREKIPVTFCAAQTSMTGASVALDGLLVSCETISGVTDIFKRGDEIVVKAKPGTIVSDLQKIVAKEGYFYPVGTTSKDECSIGGNINTNATGEDSYKYGPVRHYVRELKIIKADGSELVLKRESDERPSWERNRAGYFLKWKNPIDLFIGSEGTLGYISEIALSLLPKVPDFFSLLIPFNSNKSALEFIVDVTQKKKLNPRALELVDWGAYQVMMTNPTFQKFSDKTRSLVYLKGEYESEKEFLHSLDQWLKEIEKFSGKRLANETMVATKDREKEEFRLWRHHIPATVNERARRCWNDGGGKIGSDWWVPINKIVEMMDYFYEVAGQTGLYNMGYAHLGNGHPHTNLLASNASEKRIAHDVLLACCKKAVSLGGGVAGEHGVGKLHRDLLPIQYSSAQIEKMIEWKTVFDPNWILGRGNIFELS
ncbi:MAG: FAD-binding oxidoreductase [Pseudomonadota bacterium]